MDDERQRGIIRFSDPGNEQQTKWINLNMCQCVRSPARVGDVEYQ